MCRVVKGTVNRSDFFKLTNSLQKGFVDLTSDLGQVETEIKQTSPAYAELTQPQPLTAREIQHELDANTVLLEYSLGKNHSYLWTVTSDGISSYDLPKREQIEAVALGFTNY